MGAQHTHTHPSPQPINREFRRGYRQSSEARDTHTVSPQSGPKMYVLPLLSFDIKYQIFQVLVVVSNLSSQVT